jgi:hypothetical protein
MEILSGMTIVYLAISQPTERQRVGNQIDAAMIFARLLAIR